MATSRKTSPSTRLEAPNVASHPCAEPQKVTDALETGAASVTLAFPSQCAASVPKPARKNTSEAMIQRKRFMPYLLVSGWTGRAYFLLRAFGLHCKSPLMLLYAISLPTNADFCQASLL